MSSDVFIQVIRKKDCCPFSRIYLGGTSLKNEIKWDIYNDSIILEPTVMGCYVSKFWDAESLKSFLDTYSEQISSYGGYMNLEEDYPHPLDDFYYWLLIEE